MESWLQDNDKEVYSTHSKGKSVVAEKFNKKIYKCMISISKNIYIDKLDVISNKFNSTYHNTITMKPVDVKSTTCNDSAIENNDKDPKFKVGDHVSKYKNICAQRFIPNWSEDVFEIQKVKKSCAMDICC